MKKTITELKPQSKTASQSLKKNTSWTFTTATTFGEEEYQKAGWRHDPFPEELEEEAEEEEEDWHYHSMEERLNEVGMSMRDFF